MSLNNYNVMLTMNNYLSVKSAINLRCASHIFKDFIIVKKFYHIFKQLNCSVDNVIKMLFNADPLFIEQEKNDAYFYNILFHKYGYKIKDYVLNTKYRYHWCIVDFAQILIDETPEENSTLLELACIHCCEWTNYSPLQGLLIELCVNTDLI